MKLRELSVEQYLDALASAEPIPGGGSSSALVAASGLALGEMVSSILLLRKKENDAAAAVQRKEVLESLKKQFSKMRSEVSKVIDEDARVYSKIIRAYQAVKQGKEKEVKLTQTMVAGFEVMFRLAATVVEAKKSFAELEKWGNKSIMNDVIVGKVFLEGAYQGAFLTAKINADYISDVSIKNKLLERLSHLKGS